MKFVTVSSKKNYGSFRKFNVVILPEEIAKKSKELDIVEEIEINASHWRFKPPLSRRP